ncbi:acetyltransferase [Pseudomonas urmiensis]|jgi:sugar O-acyltransferase (sialic acid O-acetyltransferase NeuD family)|uniref:Acetyltransferase n=1 Tax=Pseudomonas urmiensis TaxID=2745493 RepID=A0ABW8NX50_9PSED
MGQSQPLVLLGAGGHAKVLLSLAQAAGRAIIGVCDPLLVKQGVQCWRGIPVVGGDDALLQMDRAKVGLINGIGQLVQGNLRQRVFQRHLDLGFQFPVMVHPAAWVDPSATLGQGVQVMAGAVIQADVMIGNNCIVNTRAAIDHDCRLESHIHIAPGATLCGSVHVESGAFIGCGANIIQGLRIGHDSVVGAGATLVRNLSAHQILLGAAPRTKTSPFE